MSLFIESGSSKFFLHFCQPNSRATKRARPQNTSEARPSAELRSEIDNLLGFSWDKINKKKTYHSCYAWVKYISIKIKLQFKFINWRAGMSWRFMEICKCNPVFSWINWNILTYTVPYISQKKYHMIKNEKVCTTCVIYISQA